MAYLRELRRVLGPRGVAVTTWFLFDKREFPMMQENQAALFINSMNPTNAVIYDREWLLARFAEIGLVPTGVDAPAVRGFQWMLRLIRADSGVPPVDLPDDVAAFGVIRAGTGGVDPHLVGIHAG